MDMKICIVAEGCYPYVVGGVSGWINSMIKSFPECGIYFAGDCGKPYRPGEVCL